MRETKGRADGGEVNRLIREKIGSLGRPSRQAYHRRSSRSSELEVRQMSRLIRMDHTGHSTLAEWTAGRPGRVRRRRRAFRRELDQGYIGVVTEGEGRATQVRELPADAELVIMRRPIAGG